MEINDTHEIVSVHHTDKEIHLKFCIPHDYEVLVNGAPFNLSKIVFKKMEDGSEA